MFCGRIARLEQAHSRPNLHARRVEPRHIFSHYVSATFGSQASHGRILQVVGYSLLAKCGLDGHLQRCLLAERALSHILDDGKAHFTLLLL